MKLATFIVILFLLMIQPVSGDIYTWTDQNGVKHFSNQPPPDATDLRQWKEIKHSQAQYNQWDEGRDKDQKSILEKSRQNNSAAQKSAAGTVRVTKNPGSVEMYTTPRCGYCIKARSFFSRHNISYTEYNIRADKGAHDRFKALNGRGVPLIFVGEKRISGFNEPLLRTLFGIQ
jgi:glutaredoxin